MLLVLSYAYMDDKTPTLTNESSPDTAILRKAGLTESQAKGYLALIEYGELSPAELAEKTNENRTNGYMICDKLEKLGLATKKESAGQRKKTLYTPNHPSALETLAEKRRKAIQRAETEVKQGIDPLIDMFYAATEMPGARTLQGIDGIKEVYADTLKSTDKTIHLLRTTADGPTLGHDYYNDYRKKRAVAGISTYALTPMTEISYQHVKSGEDEKLLYFRTPIPLDSYTAPVEIDVYGNRVAFIAFGDTQMATIIDSRPIADAMRQILGVLRIHFKDTPIEYPRT